MACTECGTHKIGRGLRRGRCGRCYEAHLKELKAAGTFTPIDLTQPLEQRLFGKALAGWGGCLVWTGRLGREGYGHIGVRGQQKLAHRVAYDLIIGVIPDGMHLDHLCHTHDKTCPGGATCPHRRCINPYHLEPVTARENTLRSRTAPPALNAVKTHCPRGHAYDEANTWRSKSGSRHCRKCLDEHQRRYRAAAKGAAEGVSQ